MKLVLLILALGALAGCGPRDDYSAPDTTTRDTTNQMSNTNATRNP